MFREILLTAIVAVGLGFANAPDPENPDPKTPSPIAAHDSVFLEELTWMEIRDAMQDGTDTIIIATGGMEQNGPYLAAGKHNYVLRATTEALARKLGNALVAPIIPFVPEGKLNPPTSHMKYPTTISLTEETYRALLREVCSCFKTHGFANIVLIGDSGGNQAGLKAVADELNKQWNEPKPRIHYVAEYYNYGDVAKWLTGQGIRQVPEGLHDDFAITATMMTVDPTTVRMKERIAADKFRINGIDLAPAEKTIDWGKRVVDFRVDATIKALRPRLNR